VACLTHRAKPIQIEREKSTKEDITMRWERRAKRLANEIIHPLDIAADVAPSTREVNILAMATEVHLLGNDNDL
jgi:hypothetical protein